VATFVFETALLYAVPPPGAPRKRDTKSEEYISES
jgi:uncharacterized protein